MTAVVARQSRPQPAAAPHRPSLRLVVSRPLVAGRLPFALLIGGILAAGLIVLLLLHTIAAQDAYRLQALQQASSALSDTRQQLALADQQRQAPDALAARARSLGMVPTGSIAFVRLHHHHRIVGVVRAAPVPVPVPVVTAKPTSKPTHAATRPAKRPAKRAAPPHRRVSRRRHG